jgi:hypothetical protein
LQRTSRFYPLSASSSRYGVSGMQLPQQAIDDAGSLHAATIGWRRGVAAAAATVSSAQRSSSRSRQQQHYLTAVPKLLPT